MTEIADRLPPKLSSFVRVLLKVEGAIISLFTLIMGLTFFVVVVLRYGLNADLFAYEEWLLVICFWLYLLASSVGTYHDVHVNADILSYAIKDQRLAWIRRLAVNLIEVVVTAVLIYWSILMVADELSFYPNLQASNALRIPLLVPRLAMPVGFGLMLFFSLLHLYVLVKLGPKGELESDAGPEIP